MNIQTHPEDRKVMVKAISEHLAMPAEYLRTPTYAYQIGKVTVNRDGSINCEDEALARELIPMLLDEGFLDEAEVDLKAVPLEADQVDGANVPPCEGDTPANLESPEKLPAEADAPADGADGADIEEAAEPIQKPDSMTIEVHVDWLTPEQMRSFINILYNHQKLLNDSFGKELICIDDEVVRFLAKALPETRDGLCLLIESWKREGKLRGVDLKADAAAMEFPFDEDIPLNWTLYSELFNRIVESAKATRRVKTELIETDNGKYYMHGWLLRMGFGGADFKALRSLMLSKLKGWCAFKDAEAAEKHKSKYSAIRKSQRAEAKARAALSEANMDEAVAEEVGTDE